MQDSPDADVCVADDTIHSHRPVVLEIEEDVVLDSGCAASIGVALAGQHFAMSSVVLDDLIAKLPPVVIPIHWVSTYESWLF